MRALKFRLVHLALWLVCAFFLRKMTKSSAAVNFLREQSEIFRPWRFAENKQLNETLQRIQSPAVIMLNKHALNITLNFLCNLRKFERIPKRVVVFAFDSYSHSVIQKSFADVSVIRWNLLALEDRFGAGDGRYQLFQYFRAQLASYLTQTVAGGYFFVRSSPITQKFFEEISKFLLNNFATDNNLMTRQCLQGLYGCRCASIPYSVISNCVVFLPHQQLFLLYFNMMVATVQKASSSRCVIKASFSSITILKR
uniref:Nucleotide-diphospho-sugar transferase domain-containing protein n=1 Tax=Ditylenchus dipsaci TaxID=166011 RepID=A0A915DGP3_9BILA